MQKARIIKKILVLLMTLAMMINTFPPSLVMAEPGDMHTIIYAPGAQGDWEPEDNIYLVEEGDAAPVFGAPQGLPGWKFAGWNPSVSSPVYSDAVYTASWYKITGVKGNQTLEYHITDEIYINLHASGVGSGIRFDLTVDNNGEESIWNDIDPNKSGTFTHIINFAGVSITIAVHGNALQDLEDLVLESYKVVFYEGEHGAFAPDTQSVFLGLINTDAIPEPPGIIENPGWRHVGWSPDLVPGFVTGDLFFTAIYEQRLYTITYSPGAQGIFEVEEYNNMKYGDETPDFQGALEGNPGYSFDGWDVGTIPGTVTDNAVYTAQWSVNYYNVYYSIDGDTDSIIDSKNPYKSSDSVIIINEKPAKPCYSFGGWVYNGGIYLESDIITMPAHDITLVAQWLADNDIYYYVHYYLNLTENKLWPEKIVSGQTMDTNVTEDAVPVPGYKALDPTSKTITLASTDNEIIFYYEARDDIFVTFDSNGGDVPTPPYKTVTFDAEYGTLADVSRPGYDFEGWFTEATGGELVDAATIVKNESDHILYAQWTESEIIPVQILVIFDANGGEAPEPESMKVILGEPYGKLPSSNRNNYTFNGWFTEREGGVEITADTIMTVTTDHILYAQWTIIDTDTGEGGDGEGGDGEGGDGEGGDGEGGDGDGGDGGGDGTGTGGGGGGGDGDGLQPTPTPTPVPTPAVAATPKPPRTPTPMRKPAIVRKPAIEPTQQKPTANIDDEISPAGPIEIFIDDHVAYILGYEDGTVRPERNVTRAEVATVFYRLLTENMRAENWTLNNTFADVSDDGWYNAAISVINNMEIIKGYPDGTFRPDASITRAELATIAARFARAMQMSGDNDVDFVDIAGHWAGDDIIHAAIIGWVSGYPDKTFKPDQFITRAEFITLANNVLRRTPENIDDLIIDEMNTWVDNSDESEWYYIAMQEATNSHTNTYWDGKTVPGKQFEYEHWVTMMPNPDWIHLEKQWIAEYTTN